MLALPEMQNAFAAELLGERRNELRDSIRSGPFSATEVLRVYRNNFFITLTEALADIYPVIKRLVGEEFFSHTASQYIRRHPSRAGNLHEFGCHLAEFLSGFPPVRELPYLPDVARLEWAWHESYHAADAPDRLQQELAQVPTEAYAGLRFRLHPTLRLLASDFPVLSIWSANQDDGDGAVDLAAGGEQLCLMRRDMDIEMRLLPATEWRLLAGLARELGLGEAVAAAGADLNLNEALGRFAAWGVLVGATLAYDGQETPA
jgi:hypothetical protein